MLLKLWYCVSAIGGPGYFGIACFVNLVLVFVVCHLGANVVEHFIWVMVSFVCAGAGVFCCRGSFTVMRFYSQFFYVIILYFDF